MEANDGESRASGSLSGGRSRRARVAAGVVLLLIVLLAIVVRRETDLSLDPRILREQIAELGWWAPAAFVVAASFRFVLVLPSWVLMATGGLLFGAIGGALLGTLGFTISALAIFGISRGLGRDAVAGRLSGGLERIDGYLERRGPRWMAVYTALPVTPLTPAQMAAGLSSMSLMGFSSAVAAGLLPRTALFSYFGDSLAEGDVQQMIIAGVIVVAAVAVATLFVRRQMGRERIDEGESVGKTDS